MAKIIEITTTIGCKVNCKYCPQERLTKAYCSKNPSNTTMSIEIFKNCIDKLSKDVIVDFAGMAEPWLNEECTDMVEYAVSKGHKVWIYTTLVGMSFLDIERLNSLDIEQLVIHLPDKSGYADIPIDDDYLTKLKKITQLDKVGRMSCSSQDIIDSRVEEIVNIAELDVGYEINDRAGNLIDDKIKNHTKEGSCVCALTGLGLTSNILLPDGTVLLCCMDYGMNHILGNLNTQSYEDIINSEELLRVRTGLSHGNGYGICKNCINALTIEELAEQYVKYRDNQDDLWNENQFLKRQLKFSVVNNNHNLIDEYNKMHRWADELTEAKRYLENQNNIKDSRIEEITNWNLELTKAKDYCENQIKLKDKRINELVEWSEEQEKTKLYLENQIRNKDNRIAELQKWSEEQENSRMSMEDQINNRDGEIVVLQQKIEECSTINTRLEETNELSRNEIKKLNYKLSALINDPIIKKVIKFKKYDV